MEQNFFVEKKTPVSSKYSNCKMEVICFIFSKNENLGLINKKIFYESWRKAKTRKIQFESERPFLVSPTTPSPS